MNILSFSSESSHDSYVFTILRFMSKRPKLPTRPEIKEGMRLCWVISPDAGSGRKAFDRAFREARQQELIDVELGAGGGFFLTPRGWKVLENALARRRYAGSRELQITYRRCVWPEESDSGIAMAA